MTQRAEQLSLNLDAKLKPGIVNKTHNLTQYQTVETSSNWNESQFPSPSVIEMVLISKRFELQETSSADGTNLLVKHFGVIAQLIAHCEPFISFSVHLFHTQQTSAPGQPPQNVEWNLIGSQLVLQWDPVIALETESEVTGYIVSDIISLHPENALGFFIRVSLKVTHCFPFSSQAFPFLHCEPNNDGSNYNVYLHLILLIYIIRVVRVQ